MNPELAQRILSHQTLDATGPFLALAIGVLVLVLIEILPALAALRSIAFLAALGAAAWAATRTLFGPEIPVFDGTYVANSTTSWWSLLFVASTLIAWVFGRRYYREEVRLEGEHDILLLTAASGMVLMAGSRDLLVFFVGLETLSVPLYALSAFRRSRSESVEAGMKYFVLGAFAAAVYLMGAALVYAATGTIQLSVMAARSDLLQEPLALTGIAMLAGAIFFKISVFPFHLWVPDVYQGAPSPVTTFMATGTKAAAFAFLLPLAFVLPIQSAGLIAAIALLTMAAGNLGALVQTDMKRLLAYSGIAHAGTMLLAIAGLSGDPQTGAASQAILFYMAAYTFTAGGAFGLVTMLESQTGRPVTIESLRGLSRKRPGIAAALTLFMLSLGGIPATGGFLGKYLIFSVAVRAEMIPAAVIGVLLSVVALGYYLRIVIALYMQPEVEGRPVPTETRPVSAAMAIVCAIMVLVLGVLPGWFLTNVR
ncbi:MAG: NADH-quinone oxidoreductase subunit N [Planctomycetota bacterium]|nr:NADH-quinone oxidoreductase subunit N [Planctomycetota bacterium]